MASNEPTNRSTGLLRTFYPSTLQIFQRDFDWRITGRWMLYSALVGVVAALGAIVFSNLVDLVSGTALFRLVGYHPPLPGAQPGTTSAFDLQAALSPLRRGLLFLVPTVGGLISGWLVFTYAPEAAGPGTDAVIEAFHEGEGRIRPRVPLIKTLASAITIGTGGSAGQEGPIGQIGAGLSSILAHRLNLNARDRRILLVSGMAAGIGSIFRSPLGGAFFAVEVLYREDLESEALMPAVVASITGYSIYSTLEESHSVFTTPEFHPINPLELLPIIGFALGCAMLAIVYVRIFDGIRTRFFDALPLPSFVKPAVGGLLVGCLAFFFPAVLGSSYGWLQQAINGNLPLTFMAVLGVAKIAATSLTIGSGASGGVFAPSLVIGGMLGGLFGNGLHALAPGLVTQPQAYVMIGMATFFAGAANVPIAMTVMISELTGRYTLLVPLIFAAVITHIISRSWSLYQHQVPAYNDSPAHRFEFTSELLRRVHVGHLIDQPEYFHTLHPDHTLDDILSVFTRTREVILPVETSAEDDERYSGLVLLDDVQSLLQTEDMMRHLIVARDLEVPFVAVHRYDTLDTVLDVFVDTQYPELPVVDDEGEIVGFVRQGQVINEYYRAVLREKRVQPAP